MANIIDLVVKGKTSEATAGVDKLSKSMTNLKSSVLLTTNNFIGFVKTLSKLTDYTDGYNTSVRLLKTTLGNSTEQATQFINKLGEMSGISTATLNKQTAKFVQLGESLNFSNEQAEKFSENLSILSTKLSLLYNMDYETMANSLQKAVQGSQVTLKSRTGIAINDVSLQATLNANAINREVSSLNDAEKAIVRYATILRQVTNDTSVYQDAVNSLAWQKQMLSYQMKKLAAVTGQLLTPALTQLYIVMNGVIMAAIEIVKILGKLFNINVDISGSVSSTADDYDDLGASIGKAANIAKKSLRGFDKLNNITTPSTSGGSGAFGIDSALLKLLDEVDENFLDIENKATEIKNQILQWLGINDDLSNAEEVFKKIWNWIRLAAGLLIGSKLADLLGLKGKKKFGLSIAITSMPFYIEGLQGIANGELTGENFMKAFASSAGLGIGAGMLTGNWKFGLILTIAAMSFAGGIAIGEAIKKYVPDSLDFYIDKFNLDYNKDNWVQQVLKTIGIMLGTIGDAIVKGITDNLPEWLWGSWIIALQKDENQKTVADKASEFIYGVFEKINIDSVLPLKILKDIYTNVTTTIPQNIEDIKKLLIKLLKRAILEIADTIEKIPVIGNGIAYAIRQGISSSENDITTTIEDTTTSSIDTAKSKINNTSTEAGKEASSKYLGGMKDKFDQERNNLTRNIQTTVSSASSAAEATATTSGSKIANKEVTTIGDTIYNNKNQLGTKVTNTVKGANNLVDTSSSVNVGNKMGQGILSGVDNSGIMSNLSWKGALIGEEFGDSISRNMQVNGSTLGRTMNSALSGVISKIRNNNWSLFGSGGALSNLLKFNWSYFADGGFPTEGDLFFANEAGPELVGTMNNHPAVANNDQIVKGIQSGVFNAMMSALSNTDFGGSNVTIEANGDTEGLLSFIEFKQKQKSRQFN